MTHNVQRRRLARRLLLTASTIAIAIAANDQRALAGGGPTGGQVVAGQASITAPNGTSTLIKQSSQKAVINWQSFSIAQGNSVQFAQPNASAIALNRVIGNTPSNINGSLFANGQVWLINGNGIIFGKGAQINVGSLIATTADMRDGDFMAGNYSFGMASANPNSAVDNHGTITVAKGGAAILAGASVSNDGLIRANMGQVSLASGSTFTVDFAGDNLLRFAVASPVTQTPKDENGNPKAALVSNSGTISNPGGQVTMTARAANDVVDNVINNTGMVEATSVSEKNGEIILDAGSGTAEVSGTLDASGAQTGQAGGNVQILGNTVQVADNTNINVSGHSGGGSVLIGGNLHGAGPQPNAQTTTVGKAVITADATQAGNGGSVVVYSTGQTNFAASVSAKGGALGGNGGQVETSGAHLHVDTAASVDTSAPKGATGNWLLDPDYVVIASDGETSLPQNGTLDVNADSGEEDDIDPSTITNALQTTDVTLEAKYELDVYNDLDYSSSHALSLLSEGNIFVAANVQNAGSGAVNVIAGWDGTTTDPAHFTDSGVYGNNQGQVIISKDDDFDYGDSDEADEGEVGNLAIGSADGATTVAGNYVYIQAQGGYAQIGYHGAGGGDINVLSNGDIAISNDVGEGNYAQIGNGSANGDVNGAITGNISVKSTGTTFITDQTGGEGGIAWIGNVASETGTESGNLTLIAGSVNDSGAHDLIGQFVVADLGNSSSTGGDVTVGLTGDNGLLINSDLPSFASPHTLNLLATNNVSIEGSIQNDGTGDINVVAGWDGQTLDPAHFTDAGVFGNGGTVTIGGPDASKGVAVGSNGGTTTVAGTNVNVDAGHGYAQIGYQGGGASGNIKVSATDNVMLWASSDSECGSCDAQIGHGGVETDADNSGNITVNAGGDVSLNGGANEFSFAQIGNGGDSSDSNNTGGITVNAGGSVLVTGGNDYAQIGNGGWGVTGDISGNVAVTAGQDVTLTGGPDSENDFFGYAQIGNGGQESEGSYTGNVSVTAGGTTSLTSGSVNQWDSNYVLIGNGAADGSTTGNASGDVSVITAGNLELDPSAGAQVWVGNSVGSEDTETGNLTMVAGVLHDHGSNLIGQIITSNLGTSDDTGGNVTVGQTLQAIHVNHDLSLSTPHALSILSGGDINVGASIQNSGIGAINLVAGWDGHTLDTSHFANVGVAGNGDGTVTIGGVFADGNAAVGSKGGATTVIGANVNVLGINGYAQIGYHGDGGTGAITVIANGTNVGDGNGKDAQPAPDVSDCFSGQGNICVIGGSAESETDGPTYAQIGDLGQGVAGTATSNITVTANNNLSVAGGGIYTVNHADPMIANAYGQIGNGDASFDTQNQTASGNIFVSVGGQTYLASSHSEENSENGSDAWIGNRTFDLGSQSGNITFVSGTVEGDDLAPMVIEDLGGYPGGAGGDVIVGLTAQDAKIDKTVEYTSPHAFSVLSTGSVLIENALQNQGSGAINVVAGWDGTTLDAAHFTDAGVFGNNGNVVLIGGANAQHESALGSKGGKTTVAAASVSVQSDNAFAMLGYYGYGGGDIDVHSLGHIDVLGYIGLDAQIGNGGPNLSGGGNITGNITLVSGNNVTVDTTYGYNSYAQIGNGGANTIGNVSGDISINTPATVYVNATNHNAYAQIGNGGQGASGNVSGNINVTSGYVSLIASPSAGVSTASGATAHIGNGDAGMNASNTGGTITGDVNVNAQYVDIVADTSAESYIGNGGSLAGGTISGDIAVTSAPLSSPQWINLQAEHGGASLIGNIGGPSATESGLISVTTPGTLMLYADFGNSSLAVIGDGSDFTSNAHSDDVTLTAHTITAPLSAQNTVGVLNTVGVFANSLTINLTGANGSAGTLGAPIPIDTNSVAVTGNNADAFLGSLRALSIGVGSNGISLGGGDFVLSETGDLTQTQGISANNVTVTSSGGVALNNTGNDVTGTVSLSGGNDVSFANAVATTLGASSGNNVTVTTSHGGISVAGTVNGATNVSLSAPGEITEASGGAITGGGLVATSTGGGIALGNSANNVTGMVQLSALNDATFDNASAIALGGSNANNLTLTAVSGGITLTGAVTATGNALFNAAGDIGEGTNGSLTAHDFVASSTGGGISFTAPNNAVTGTLALSAMNDIAFANTVATTLGATSGNHVTVSTSTGGIAVDGTVHGTTNVSLTAPGDLTEGAGGSVTGGGLAATSTGGGIALNNAGNAMSGTVSLTAAHDASLANSVATTLGASSGDHVTVTTSNGGISVTGTVNGTTHVALTAPGDISETSGGAVTGGGLNVISSNGGIALGNAANAITGTVQLSAQNDATFENASAIALDISNADNFALTALSGGITLTGATTATGNATFNAAGDIAEGANGSLSAQNLTATSTNGGITFTAPNNAVAGTVALSGANDVLFSNTLTTAVGATSGKHVTISTTAGGIAINGAVTGSTDVSLTAPGDITEGSGGTLSGGGLSATSTGGGILLTATGNAVGGSVTLSAHNGASLYDISSVTLGGLLAGGDVAILSKGSITAPSSIGTADNVTLVAGWDGTTTNLANITNAGAYGNNSGNVTIGGAGASGNVAVGSTSGTTTVEGAGVQLAAVNGYAMIGKHGAGTGAVVVNATGNVSLTGGAGTNDFAQIGNGGQGISGNDSGAISVTAGGDVILTGGAGGEAYAQIGQGGAETNAASNGYTNDSTINVHATNATLTGGSGSGAYVQIGQGGFKAGENLAGGTATNSGNVSVIVTHSVALNGSTGNDAYAQIGNGGDQSNANAAASAHGLNTGDITVQAPNGPNGSVTLKAGNGTDAYADIGNGGFGANENTQAVPANFVSSGNVSVTDLLLQGGNGGANAFSQIGNGGPGSVGNVSGNITIDANGNIQIIPGTAPGSGANISNVTGDGTVTGSITGFVSPNDAALNGAVNTSINGNNTPKNITNSNDVYIPPSTDNGPSNVIYSASFLTTNDKGDNAIADLNGGENGDETSSDTLTVTVANSLTKSKGSNSQVVIIGLLKQYTPMGSNTPHGVPPADQEYSSWGNEAFWQ